MKIEVQMNLHMNLFIHMKVHMKVQKRLQVRVHEGWAPSSVLALVSSVRIVAHRRPQEIWEGSDSFRVSRSCTLWKVQILFPAFSHA